MAPGSSRRRVLSVVDRRVPTHIDSQLPTLISFCVRTVSHTPRNPGHTPSFTGTRRCILMLREVVDRKCVGGIQYASARAKGINFQACSFNHSDVSPL